LKRSPFPLSFTLAPYSIWNKGFVSAFAGAKTKEIDNASETKNAATRVKSVVSLKLFFILFSSLP
jgi:hypothetical protein